ncbi:Bgt-50499 [Blumeria graminis f. sp. tritici]|uniref:Bgt-50499 n=1 Tax=Blumeria graminis f. sp. tritici TaxID=62690 RepID=A0A9X9MKM2_BLUGR|nr:Bgt-50499 [Blumeria graminis f. sp. tritici]
MPSIRGTIFSQYFWESMEPHSFSQNKQGPFSGPAKQPQNIHPTLFFDFSPTQSALYSWEV